MNEFPAGWKIRGLKCAHKGTRSSRRRGGRKAKTCPFDPVVIRKDDGGVEHPYCGYHDPERRRALVRRRSLKKELARATFTVTERVRARSRLPELAKAHVDALRAFIESFPTELQRSAFAEAARQLSPEDFADPTDGPCVRVEEGPHGLVACGKPGRLVPGTRVILCKEHFHE